MIVKIKGCECDSEHVSMIYDIQGMNKNVSLKDIEHLHNVCVELFHDAQFSDSDYEDVICEAMKRCNLIGEPILVDFEFFINN